MTNGHERFSMVVRQGRLVIYMYAVSGYLLLYIESNQSSIVS